MAPRKPNYDFERREREKAKAGKKEERAKAKAERGAELAATQPGTIMPSRLTDL